MYYFKVVSCIQKKILQELDRLMSLKKKQFLFIIALNKHVYNNVIIERHYVLCTNKNISIHFTDFVLKYIIVVLYITYNIILITFSISNY